MLNKSDHQLMSDGESSDSECSKCLEMCGECEGGNDHFHCVNCGGHCYADVECDDGYLCDDCC
jgi:hypothetical protein